MKSAVLLRECENLTRRCGIDIRYTQGGPSGLCTVHGEQVMFIDRTLDDDDKLTVYARELSRLDLDSMYLVPALRKLLAVNGPENEW